MFNKITHKWLFVKTGLKFPACSSANSLVKSIEYFLVDGVFNYPIPQINPGVFGVPDFLMEIRSKSDSISFLKYKYGGVG